VQRLMKNSDCASACGRVYYVLHFHQSTSMKCKSFAPGQKEA
jgi:hypothetical protein